MRKRVSSWVLSPISASVTAAVEARKASTSCPVADGPGGADGWPGGTPAGGRSLEGSGEYQSDCPVQAAGRAVLRGWGRCRPRGAGGAGAGPAGHPGRPCPGCGGPGAAGPGAAGDRCRGLLPARPPLRRGPLPAAGRAAGSVAGRDGPGAGARRRGRPGLPPRSRRPPAPAAARCSETGASGPRCSSAAAPRPRPGPGRPSGECGRAPAGTDRPAARPDFADGAFRACERTCWEGRVPARDRAGGSWSLLNQAGAAGGASGGGGGGLLPVADLDVAVVLPEVAGQGFHHVDRAVLAPGAAQGHGDIAAVVGDEAGQPALHELTDVRHHGLDVGFGIEKVPDRLVAAGEAAQRRVPVRIGQGPQIKDEVGSHRNPALEAEGLKQQGQAGALAHQPLPHGAAQVVDIHRAGVQHQAGGHGDGLQPGLLPGQRLGEGGVGVAQRVAPPGLAEALDQGVIVGIQVDHLGVDVVGQLLEQVVELAQVAAGVAGIDADGDPFGGVPGPVTQGADQLGQQGDREVVDAVVALVLQQVQGGALARAGAATDDDEVHGRSPVEARAAAKSSSSPVALRRASTWARSVRCSASQARVLRWSWLASSGAINTISRSTGWLSSASKSMGCFRVSRAPVSRLQPARRPWGRATPWPRAVLPRRSRASRLWYSSWLSSSGTLWPISWLATSRACFLLTGSRPARTRSGARICSSGDVDMALT